MDNEMNPTKDEIKLLIDNSLLEQEKRLSREFRQELEVQTGRLTSSIDKQNGLYAGQSHWSGKFTIVDLGCA